jgi:hypothetical protein
MERKHTAIESILVRSASRIGYLKTCSTLGRVVVEIQIRALVEAVMDRLRQRLVEIGVYICKAASSQRQKTIRPERDATYMLRSKVSPG